MNTKNYNSYYKSTLLSISVGALILSQSFLVNFQITFKFRYSIQKTAIGIYSINTMDKTTTGFYG